VKLSPRRSSAPADDAAVTAAEEQAAGKGRPTPKRRDSAVQRGPVSAPKTRKEAYARQKQQAKAARRTSTAAMTPQQRRAALRSGEYLAKRDMGPTRKLARDYVDSHRMFSNYLLLLLPIMVVSVLVPYVQLAVTVLFLLLLVEWYLVGRRIRRMAMERHGKAEGGSLSIGFYAGSRAYLPRRWRLPAPQVSLGDKI
jgi:hypothetical protein